jgi:hypothetical protein
MTEQGAAVDGPSVADRALGLSASACVEVGLSPRWCEQLAPVLAVALEPVIAAREAAAEQRGREMALREAADDQSWWLTEAMDGDFLLVDCGHIGHNDGRVGISDVRPTDLTRWVAEHLRERAAREAS